MSWGAVDDGFHSHRKVLRLRRSQHYTQALALWTLSLSWCCDQEQERFTGTIPCDVLTTLGIGDWYDAAELLTHVGLWEPLGDEAYQFHDWDDWNGIAGKEFRGKEQARLRKQAERLKKCEGGQHSRECPTDPPCPARLKRYADRCKAGRHSERCPDSCPAAAPRHGVSRDTGSGRAGSGRAGAAKTSREKDDDTFNGEPWTGVDVREVPT